MFTSLFGLYACSVQEKDLTGSWQAAAFFENGQSVASNLDSVSLQITPEGGYEFRSQGFYREAGAYRLSAKYLFLTDTTQIPAKEHIVKILYISADTLKIRMSAGGKEQVLFFARE
jgi:hypothetical protein